MADLKKIGKKRQLSSLTQNSKGVDVTFGYMQIIGYNSVTGLMGKAENLGICKLVSY